MNIWIISKYISYPKYNNIAPRLFILAKEFNAQGHNARIITSDSNHLCKFPATKKRFNFLKIEGVSYHWIKTLKYKKTHSLLRVLSWFDFERKLFLMPINQMGIPKVIIVSSLSLFSILFGYHLKKKFSAKLVFEIRDIWPLSMIEEGGYSKYNPLAMLMSFIEKFGYKKADLIVGTMPRLDEHVKNILGYSKPFHCSPIGFSFDQYKTKVNNFKSKKLLGLNESSMVIGYAGSMGITNALDSFIEAIELLKNNKSIFFVLVGDGDLKDKYHSQLSQCGNVKFFPRLPHSEIHNILNACDVLFLATQKSTIWDYGQSMNKVVEYMLSGKPIIAQYSGFQSMINEAGCGEFILDTDARDLANTFLKYARKSIKERLEMADRGRTWILRHRKYSLLAREYINAIKNV